MNAPIEPMLRALAPALDDVGHAAADWPEVWARIKPAPRRRAPVWPLLASMSLCLTLFLGSTMIGVVLGVTPTAAAAAVPAPGVAHVAMTPNETQAVRASAGPAAASTPAPVALPVR